MGEGGGQDGEHGGGGDGGGGGVVEVRKWVVSSQVLGSMLLVQAFATGMQLLSRVILSNGTFVFALMTYRHIVAALCVAPCAFFLERGITAKLNWVVLFWIFVNALTGITMAMGLFYYGIKDTTATYAVNFLNLVPIVTFLLSIIARVEKLGLNKIAGKIKTLGAILCVAGALTTGLYKGKTFYLIHHHHHHHHDAVHHVLNNASEKGNWGRGTCFLVGSCISYGTWYILQVKILKVLPLKYWTTMLTCIMAAIQSMVVGLCLDRSKAAWKLEWNLQLLTIVYSGAFATAATFCLISWVVSKRGPTYPPMFNPLTLIFVAVLEALILGSELSVGMLLGLVLIIVGLYSFLSGKTMDMKRLKKEKSPTAEVATTAFAPQPDMEAGAEAATSSSGNDVVAAESAAEIQLNAVAIQTVSGDSFMDVELNSPKV